MKDNLGEGEKAGQDAEIKDKAITLPEGDSDSESESPSESESESESDDQANMIPGMPEGFIKAFSKLPADVRKLVVSSLSLFSFSGVNTSVSGNPLFSKFKDSHINKWLDLVAKEDHFEHEEFKIRSRNNLIYFIVAIIFLGAMFVYFGPNQSELLMKILQILVAFAGGFGAGYGLKAHKGGREQ